MKRWYIEAEVQGILSVDGYFEADTEDEAMELFENYIDDIPADEGWWIANINYLEVEEMNERE